PRRVENPNLRSTKSSFPGFPNHFVCDSWGVGNGEADACTATPCATTSGTRSRISFPAARAMSAVRQPTIACSSTRSSIAIAQASRGAIYLSATDIGRLFTDGTGDGAKKSGFMRVFEIMSRDADNEFLMLDATIVRAHQHSAGAQKKTARIKRSAVRGADCKIHTAVDV